MSNFFKPLDNEIEFETINVLGDADISGNVSIDGYLLLSDGLETTPSLTFAADTDTGIYRPSDNELAITCGGNEIMSFAPASANIIASNLVNATAGVDTNLIQNSSQVSFLIAGGNKMNVFAGSIAFEDRVVIDDTDTEAFLVRINADGGDVFAVDTQTPAVKIQQQLVYNVSPTDEYFLQTDGSGNASWVDITTSLNVSGNASVDATTFAFSYDLMKITKGSSSIVVARFPYLLRAPLFASGSNDSISLPAISDSSFYPENIGANNLRMTFIGTLSAATTADRTIVVRSDGTIDIYTDPSLGLFAPTLTWEQFPFTISWITG